MLQISKTRNPSGGYPPLMNCSTLTDGWLEVVCEDTAFYAYNGFVVPVVEKGKVVGFTKNEEAYEAWKAALPDPMIELRAAKEEELSAACNAAIVAGMDVETSNGTEHFSLQETDQINLAAACNAVLSGAASCPYHADGALCRMFTAEEITAVSNASAQHKLYHTILCNHLMAWARRAQTQEELVSIRYTADNLPEDLAENMSAILSAAQSV